MRGGDVCVVVSRDFKPLQIGANIDIVDDGFELVMADIVATTGHKTSLIAIYWQPHIDNVGVSRINDLIACLEGCVLKCGPTFIVGVLNCPSVNWSAVCSSTSGNPMQIIADFLSNVALKSDSTRAICHRFAVDCDLWQIHDKPTASLRQIEQSTANLLQIGCLQQI